MLSAHVAASTVGPPAWTSPPPSKPSGHRLLRDWVSLSMKVGAGLQTRPKGAGDEARGVMAQKEGTPHPVAGRELWMGTRLFLRASSFQRSGAPRTAASAPGNSQG